VLVRAGGREEGGSGDRGVGMVLGGELVEAQ